MVLPLFSLPLDGGRVGVMGLNDLNALTHSRINAYRFEPSALNFDFLYSAIRNLKSAMVVGTLNGPNEQLLFAPMSPLVLIHASLGQPAFLPRPLDEASVKIGRSMLDYLCVRHMHPRRRKWIALVKP